MGADEPFLPGSVKGGLDPLILLHYALSEPTITADEPILSKNPVPAVAVRGILSVFLS